MKKIATGLFLLGLAWLLVACAGNGDEVAEDTNAAMNAAATVPATIGSETDNIEGVVVFPEQLRDHDPEFRHPSTDLPPVGGTHHPIWVNCGVYTEAVPVELAIHSLEHGAIWITYQPELDAAAITTLQNLTKGQTHILVSPYPGLQSPIVLSAWARQLELDSPDDPRIAEFITAYLHGAQSPEPNVTCADGVGNPLVIQ